MLRNDARPGVLFLDDNRTFLLIDVLVAHAEECDRHANEDRARECDKLANELRAIKDLLTEDIRQDLLYMALARRDKHKRGQG